MDREEKVLEIVRSSKVGNISCEEATIQICLLFSVVGRSEQLNCKFCKSDDVYIYTCGNMVGFAKCKDCKKEFEI